MDLETGFLELLGVPIEGRGSISAGEDVLRHEESPLDVLPVGTLAQTGHLHEEEPVIFQHVEDGAQEELEVGKANMLSHLNGRDGVKGLFRLGNLAVIALQDVALLGLELLLGILLTAPCRALLRQGHADSLGPELRRRMAHKSSPSASNVEHTGALLEVQLLADGVKLVHLSLLKRLVESMEDCGSVDHQGAHEGAEKIIAHVVVIGDLLLGCGN
mmetsp:Transcript_28137/g.85994  ORF Transcript_28137/g.85994 Transcript_28137/m.85994 type:complete len:216 (-) Transcript_28137:744-1391(-)